MSGLRRHLPARHSSFVWVSLVVPIAAGAIVLGVAGLVAVVHVALVVFTAALVLLRHRLREQAVCGRVPILHLVVISIVVVAVVAVVAVPVVVEVPFDVGTFDASTVDVLASNGPGGSALLLLLILLILLLILLLLLASANGLVWCSV